MGYSARGHKELDMTEHATLTHDTRRNRAMGHGSPRMQALYATSSPPKIMEISN